MSAVPPEGDIPKVSPVWYADLKMPVVIVGRARQLIDIDTQSARLYSDISQSWFHRVAGTGHAVQQTATDQLMSAMSEVASGPTESSGTAAE